MQLRALIELSGYCQTRTNFCNQARIKHFSLITLQQNFLKIFCPTFAGQNIRMKDNERNSKYGFNYLSFSSVFILQKYRNIGFRFIDVNQGLGHRSMITKHCANKQTDLIITF